LPYIYRDLFSSGKPEWLEMKWYTPASGLWRWC